jgi:subtilisin family serine protease
LVLLIAGMLVLPALSQAVHTPDHSAHRLWPSEEAHALLEGSRPRAACRPQIAPEQGILTGIEDQVTNIANLDNAYVETCYVLNDSTEAKGAFRAQQWGLVQIGAPAAWQASSGSTSVVIADVGSGIDTDHPDLAGQLWVNPGEVGGNGLDDDGNGYEDDLHGWNLIDDNADLSDNTGHSTIVAAIMAAAPNHDVGAAGVCPDCRLMIVKVTRSNGLAYYSDVARGIAYAAQNGADVINVSLRGRHDAASVRSAIAATSQKAVVVSGAGNDGTDVPVYPAGYERVLAVASTNRTDMKLGTSNYGTWVDVSAPGQGIVTAADGGGYCSRSGTSVAAPFVSGLAGLLGSLHPDWSPDQVRAQILRTADQIDGLNPGFEGQLGRGRINAARALSETAQGQTRSGVYAPAAAEWKRKPCGANGTPGRRSCVCPL